MKVEMKLLLIILFLLSPQLFSQEDSSDSIQKLVRLLEVTSSNTNISNRAPETIGSLLTSMRLTNSLTSNSGELFKEINRTNENTSSSKIKYSHQFDPVLFVSLSYASSAQINYERTTIGSQSAYIIDKVHSNFDQKKINFGVGPLDYLADFSFEFSLGHESGKQNGPFLTNGIRFPRLADKNVLPGNIFSGTGAILFNYNAYSFNMGTSGLWDWFGMYALMELQYIKSSLSLSSIGYDTKGTSNVPKNQFYISLNPHLQYAYLKFPAMQGFLLNFELGFIFKIFEHLGIKTGGYYQIAYIENNTPKGFYYNNNSLNEASSEIELTSAAKRRNMGFWGVNFGIVSKF